jgi:SulP family sulfate permease
MLEWLRQYRRAQLPGDIGAGIVVAMMMIPQGMAYAMVAGLPPVVGLYASIVPPLLYALFGSSMTQSIGPMAITSLMTASVLAPLAAPGSGLYMVLAAQLALLSGGVLLVCGLLRIGFLANFFSRPVMNGFTLGSAIVIALGQGDALLGATFPHFHLPSAMLGIGALALLLLARRYLAPLLRALGMQTGAADVGARLAPMVLVLAAMVLSYAVDLAGAGVRTTGAIPAGLPGLNLATSAPHWRLLFQPALLIGFMIFLISMSGAQTLALKRAEKLRSNHELIGLGAACRARPSILPPAPIRSWPASLRPACWRWRWLPRPGGWRCCRCRCLPPPSSWPCWACSTWTPCALPGATTAPTRWPCWPRPAACWRWASSPA